MLMIACGVGAIGAALTLIQLFGILLGGRLILGIALGMQFVTLFRYIEEYVPSKTYGVCATILYLMITTGAFTAIVSAYMLPADARKRDFEDYEIWKVFGGTFIHNQKPPKTGESDLLDN